MQLRPCFVQVGTAKPKFPLLDAPRSALIALALELRAANPRTLERRDGETRAQQYAERRARYAEQCKFVEHARAEVVRHLHIRSSLSSSIIGDVPYV